MLQFELAMAIANNAVLYSETAYYVVEDHNEEKLKEIVNKTPSMASEDYGRPFIGIFKEAKYYSYNIDPNLFALRLSSSATQRKEHLSEGQNKRRGDD